MDCRRCHKDVEGHTLRPIAPTLRFFSLPFTIGLAGPAVRSTRTAGYCPHCRRMMTLTFGVIAFVGALMMLGVVLQMAGVMRGDLNPRADSRHAQP